MLRLTRLLKSRGHCNAIQALQCPEISAETRRYFLCLGALPLLYPAAPPSVFACGKYTAPAVALVREYVVILDKSSLLSK